jgi:glutamate-1-semialdehyde 2,1-aminomutase
MESIKGQKLWEKAKTLIPGGNQLLSKRSERFLPNLWPAYYSKAKGCEVWDLEGNRYIDFAQMGVGSCSLGYADEDVNLAVVNAIRDGSMCTLNSYEEVELAERLTDLHSWSDMVRFSRTGGEACAIAVRIGRAATGRDKIAFCGYHGWHDWYLATNLNNTTNLNEQLLPGLEPTGVPNSLKNSIFPFNYNCIEELETIISQYGNEIGVIIMEPERGTSPNPGFLGMVREIANNINAVLIFDEVTSGFRMNLGGIHLKYGVNPDIAVFGKSLGNGYPISSLIGRKEVMDVAQDSFISSTFWTERIGFVAALATLRKMESHKVQSHLISFGERLNKGWEKLALQSGIEIGISGIPPLTHLSFKVENSLEVQTLYAQEMLKKGYLLGSSVYTTFAYSNEILDHFIEESESVFSIIKEAIDSGEVKNYLKGDTIQTGFKRLT